MSGNHTLLHLITALMQHIQFWQINIVHNCASPLNLITSVGQLLVTAPNPSRYQGGSHVDNHGSQIFKYLVLIHLWFSKHQTLSVLTYNHGSQFFGKRKITRSFMKPGGSFERLEIPKPKQFLHSACFFSNTQNQQLFQDQIPA
jgi:hypothetical protein